MEHNRNTMKNLKTLEDVYDSIGGIGRFQILAFCAILLPEIPAGILTMLPVLVGVHPRSWICTEENDTEQTINSTSTVDTVLCACNATLQGGTSSIVSEWNLVCDYAWVTDFITSVQMTGMMVGSSLGSQIPDWIGRKKSMYLSFVFTLALGAASGFAPSAFVYAGTRFLIGLAIGFYINMNTVYVNEFLPANSDRILICGAVRPWTIGVTLLAIIGYFVESWRILSWISALPVAISFTYYTFLPESPRWLLQTGKIEETKEAIDSVSSWNRYPPVELEIVESLAYREIVQGCRKSEGELNKHFRIGWLQLLRNPHNRSSIIILGFTWHILAVSYYGLAFHTKNLDGNTYINLAFVGVIEGLSAPLALVTAKRFGKDRTLLACFFWSTLTLGLASFLAMELNIGIQYNSLWVASLTLVARVGASGGWFLVKCYTEESFSPEISSTVLDICSTMASIAGIIAPQVVFLGTIYRSAPYFMFAALSLMGLAAWSLVGKSKNASGIT